MFRLPKAIYRQILDHISRWVNFLKSRYFWYLINMLQPDTILSTYKHVCFVNGNEVNIQQSSMPQCKSSDLVLHKSDVIKSGTERLECIKWIEASEYEVEMLYAARTYIIRYCPFPSHGGWRESVFLLTGVDVQEFQAASIGRHRF